MKIVKLVMSLDAGIAMVTLVTVQNVTGLRDLLNNQLITELALVMRLCI